MIDLTFSMSNGDCELVFDDENMIGACIRRLDTLLGTTLYSEYGGNLRGLLGLKKTEVNLQFMSQSIRNCLLQDIRIQECNVDCRYSMDGIMADISITYSDNVLVFEYEVNSDE